MTQIKYAQQILLKLGELGLREIIVCPGSRNAPFIELLSCVENLKVQSHFEERAAGFFALGRSQTLRAPVAVVVTSGTAVAELLPAVIEAHYTATPLVVISADRPENMRHTGAPQTIDQTPFLKSQGAYFLDLHVGKDPGLEGWKGYGPLHINVCFNEPLIDDKVEPWDFLETKKSEGSFDLRHGPSRKVFHDHFVSVSNLKADTENSPVRFPLEFRPLVLIGGLNSDSEQLALQKFLTQTEAPVYAEGPSGLRECLSLPFQIQGGEKEVARFAQVTQTNFVLRVGGVPTLRFWRDLDKSQIPTLSLSTRPFAGTSHGQLWWGSIEENLQFLLENWPTRSSSSPQAQILKSRERERELDKLIKKYPFSEVSLFRKLSEEIPSQSTVYLGNSLPIREWDLAASRQTPHWVCCSRGANGIDGQIATALGRSRADAPLVIVIGDLTALYDLNSLSMKHLSEARSVHLVVINNGGGQIFSRLYTNPLYLNTHTVNFAGGAQMFGWNYRKWDFHSLVNSESLVEGATRKSPPFDFSTSGFHLHEVIPNESESKHFWQEWTAP